MKKEVDKKDIGSKKNSKKNLRVGKTFKKVASLKDRADKKKKQSRKKSNFYYSFLTIILLIFLCQIVFSAILNITKNISYSTKISKIKKTKDLAEKKNLQLRQELREFSSSESLESIARNNLKMAGDDEVLIIINDIKKQNIVEVQKNKNKGIIFNLGKHE